MIRFFIFIFFFYFLKIGYGQNREIDSLKNLPFSDLEKNFNKSYIDTINDTFYAKAYLLKSRELNDSIRIADAFFYLSEISSHTKGLSYCDSIISITKSMKNHIEYPALGYLQKGVIFYNLGDYKKALTSFLISLDYATINNNQTQILAIQGNIGIIKLELGEEEEALKRCREYVNYLEENEITHKDYYLLTANLALANAYIYNKKNDSASIFIKRGINKSLLLKDTLMYSNYLIRSGMNSYQVNRFDRAIDSLKKGVKYVNDKPFEAIANLYLGKSYLSLNNNEGIFYLQKVDSFLNKTNNMIPELINTYDPLIKFYKDKNDASKQLYYLNNLLRFDSLLNSNNKFLSKKITEKYDIPKLIKEKEDLIEYTSKRKNLNIKIIFYMISILILMLSFYFFRKHKALKKRFNLIIQQNKKQEINKNLAIENRRSSIETKLISEDLTEKILKKLGKFETSQRFLKKRYTLNSLAKEMNTNSSYLSKVINSEKKENFANYLNNLKIDYAIDRLTNDSKFRLYTIKAISEESGFNSKQSFSKAFYKKTKLHPSYFIKELNSNK